MALYSQLTAVQVVEIEKLKRSKVFFTPGSTGVLYNMSRDIC